ncbi:MAG TPA: ATP-binding cassette domain-containing protein [Chryseosolibacter sp.]|nr:ATP-binding cassette domain-containing protein [Chryseosolibacter sp.]
MVRVQNLSYRYAPGKLLTFPDLSISQGEHCLILGDSGTGKSTLLQLLGGVIRVQQGIIKIGDHDIASLSDEALDSFRGRNIGFVFQKNYLITALTVRENLLLTFFLAGAKQDSRKVDETLASLDLVAYADAKVYRLSHGQLQRAAIARAVILDPLIILADEPTSALDDGNCARVIDLLTTVAGRSQASLIIATHDARLKSRFHNQVTLMEGARL